MNEAISKTSLVWTEEHVKARLSLFQRMLLKLRGYVFLRYEKREGWNDYLPIYLVKCERHNIYFEDYPHGHSGYFCCPLCFADTLREGEEKCR